VAREPRAAFGAALASRTSGIARTLPPAGVRTTGELNTVLYKTLQWTAAPTIKLIWRPWIDGKENIPETGPVILASNHLSVADHYFLGLTTKRHIATMAKIEYFTGVGMKGKLISKTVKALGQVAVDRSGGRRSAASLEPSMKVLEEGRVFAIFPEGTRSPDGRLYRGKPGGPRARRSCRWA
jgi:1-acyl-sn-glycerol-3-phosphate acyltransferase